MQSFEAVMEIKYDHQSGYNLIVCYYIVGNTEKMKSCFTKMLLVRHYDPEVDDDIEEDSTCFQKVKQLNFTYCVTKLGHFSPRTYHITLHFSNWISSFMYTSWVINP